VQIDDQHNSHPLPSRKNGGMSDEQNNRRHKWLNVVLGAVALLSPSYFAMHYATVSYVWDYRNYRSELHASHATLPVWVEPFFWPAYRLDDLIGYPPGNPDELSEFVDPVDPPPLNQR
jgi:hypothetical protein